MASRWDPKSKITPHLSLLALNKTLTLVYFNIKRLFIIEIDNQFDQKFTPKLSLLGLDINFQF